MPGEPVNGGHILDSAQNTFCQNPVLYTLWAQGIFRLAHCYDILDDLAADPVRHLRSPEEKGVVAMKDLASGHPLLDGAVFGLIQEDPKKEVSDEPLKLQWDLLRMTGFPGPAEAANDPPTEAAIRPRVRGLDPVRTPLSSQQHKGQMRTHRNSKKATMTVA